MKRALFIISVIFTIALISSTSCKKDDESDPKSLVGTSWRYDDLQSEYYSLLLFKSVIEFEVWEYEPDEDPTLEESGTYTVSSGTITFIIDDEIYKGSITEEKITLNADGEVLIFIKQ